MTCYVITGTHTQNMSFKCYGLVDSRPPQLHKLTRCLVCAFQIDVITRRKPVFGQHSVGFGCDANIIYLFLHCYNHYPWFLFVYLPHPSFCFPEFASIFFSLRLFAFTCSFYIFFFFIFFIFSFVLFSAFKNKSCVLPIGTKSHLYFLLSISNPK